MSYTVRAMRQYEIPLMVDYFLQSSATYLRGMGVAIDQLPDRADWIALLTKDMQLQDQKKEFYYLLWLHENRIVGHCNINKIHFCDSAYMHLHIWHATDRKSGSAVALVQACLAIFFEKFSLKKIYCEPFRDNPAPHKVLKKAGFTSLGERATVPGWINYHQVVQTWIYTAEEFAQSTGQPGRTPDKSSANSRHD